MAGAVEVTIGMALPIVAREGHIRGRGRCTVVMGLTASLPGLAMVRAIPVGRCWGAVRMNVITRGLAVRSTEVVVTTDLQGCRLREWRAAVVLVTHPEVCHPRDIVLKAAPLRRGASRRGVMLNLVVGTPRGQIVPSTPWERRVSSRCHPGFEPIFHFHRETRRSGSPGRLCFCPQWNQTGFPSRSVQGKLEGWLSQPREQLKPSPFGARVAGLFLPDGCGQEGKLVQRWVPGLSIP
ncbi:MAG: hypothetical protein CJBNEKGG_00842 [Prosthecobacter sp.]|nr:hypothetical protein [Prosthecobacter sp.]